MILVSALKKHGLEKTQVLLKKPACRLNAGFSTGFSSKAGLLTENVHFWGSRSQDQSQRNF
jgi:hypothetical protein